MIIYILLAYILFIYMYSENYYNIILWKDSERVDYVSYRTKNFGLSLNKKKLSYWFLIAFVQVCLIYQL